MLGKNVTIEIFGTLCERCLYSGFIRDSFADNRPVYIVTNNEPPNILKCTIIAIASCARSEEHTSELQSRI